MDRTIDKDELKRIRRKRLLRIALWTVPAVAAVGIALSYVTGATVSEADIRIVTAEVGPLESAVAASGRVVPAFEEIISSPVASHITAVYARPGDTVSEGMPLLALDLSAVEAQYNNMRDAHLIKINELDQLRLSNRIALNDLDMQVRIKAMEVNTLAVEVTNERRLDSIGSGTGDRVRRAVTAHRTAELQLQALTARLAAERERLGAAEQAAVLALGNSARDLEQMERTVAQGRIPAPRAGVLTFLTNSIGSAVSAGEKVAVVGDLSSFKVVAEVPEGSSFKVRPGADVSVRLGNVELAGTVANVEPQSTGGAVPFTVTLADAANSRLRPGIRTQVYVSYGFKESATLIANGEYFKGPGEYTMFVADGNKLHRRRVRLGDSNRLKVEVIEGIEPGERVVCADMENYEKYKTLTLK